MDIEDLLTQQEQAIVEDAAQRTARIPRYGQDGATATRRRVEALYRQLGAAVYARDVTDLRAHASQVARERSRAGYTVADLEAALTALEEAVLDGAVASLPAYDQGFGRGLVSTALAHARDALRLAFDPAAPHAPAPYPDLSPMFRGTSRLAPCPAEELEAAA